MSELDQLLQDEKEMDIGIKEMSVKKAKKGKDKRDKIRHVSQIRTDDFILEQIGVDAPLATLSTHAGRDPDNYKFLKFNLKSGEIDIINEIQIGVFTYKPRNSLLIDKNSIFLPSGVLDYGTTTQLLEEVSEYLNKYFEVDDSMEKILPNYVLFTWVFEKFPFVPYLQFIGRTSTGKTTAGETVASICYKAIDATGAASQSAIFRVADEWGGTLFLDEFDPQVKDYEMLSFLKSGVSDRAVLRVEAEGKNFKVVPYKVKAPKIFTSESMITDAGLQSRTLVIKMQKNRRRLPLFKLNSYYRAGQELRNKLLKWRLDNLEQIDLSKIEYGYDEFQSFDRRVQQILVPIYHLSDKRGKNKILEFAKEQEERTKEERRNKEEGSIFTIIYDYYEREKIQPPLKLVTDELNKQRDEMGYKTKRSERKLGEIIRNVLGLRIERMGHDNASTILLEETEEDINKYKELVDYYGSVSLPASVESVASIADEPDIVKEPEELFNG